MREGKLIINDNAEIRAVSDLMDWHQYIVVYHPHIGERILHVLSRCSKLVRSTDRRAKVQAPSLEVRRVDN